ncbi:4Fe-4S binding protein [Faecalibacter rhinopitheci]|uniref:4Fe-4S binding protein n=1 Tax=Faecalibacter rhinopitheci TaxID=2779678 RepID=A0A8J7FPJ0_9FLAO|nr:4Fe-4S binding protein [Faecalibacter rhinopitheci]MBF0598357.1 4Fe-4S binding protein [Faecalibacter rhinopitheci]
MHISNGLFFNSSICIECGICEDVCPVNAVKLKNYIFNIDGHIYSAGSSLAFQADRCLGEFCAKCVEICPTSALYTELPFYGGDSGGNSNNNNTTLKEKANYIHKKYTTSNFRKIVDALNLGQQIKELNVEGIKTLVKHVGGELDGKVLNFLKEAPLPIKVIGVGSTIENVYKTYTVLSDGDITNSDIVQLFNATTDIASYVPGPVGLIAQGINFTLVVYEESK